jgi:hypothetical protein
LAPVKWTDGAPVDRQAAVQAIDEFLRLKGHKDMLTLVVPSRAVRTSAFRPHSSTLRACYPEPPLTFQRRPDAHHVLTFEAERVHLMTTQEQEVGPQAAIRASIAVNSEFDGAYVIMNGLATVIACYGLFSNSPAVVIGAMNIAMLLGPISGVALGLVDKDNALLRKALGTLAGGVAVVYGTAFMLGVIHSEPHRLLWR